MRRSYLGACGKMAGLLGLGVLILTLLPLCGQAKGDEQTTLSQGGVVVKDDPKAVQQQKGLSKVEAKILIPMPPEKIWPVVSNPQQLMREERKVKKIRTVSKATNSQEVEYTVALSQLLPTFNYTLRLENKQPNVIEFRRLSGSFKDFQGSWKLTPVDGGKKTVLTYSLAIDPGFFAPKFLVLQAIKSDLPSMMKNVKTAIDKQLNTP